MPLTQASLERQLQHAQSELSNQKGILEKKGVSAADRNRDPKWRHLRSRCSSISARLKAVAAVTERDVELRQRISDRAAGKPVQVVEKPKKEKKEKIKKPKKKKESSKELTQTKDKKKAPTKAKKGDKKSKTKKKAAKKGGKKGK